MANQYNQSKITESQQIIQSLYTKYNADPYMLEKTHRYITTQLPLILENMKMTHLDRCSRISEMTIDQLHFIQSFLINNQYFYVSSTELFFYYDKQHYQLISEDNILYHILSTISKDGNLMSWKQKTKINIMKRIKEENPLLKSIPESATIQHVLALLCPLLFSTRNEAKYFLTILGDNITRKNTHLIHFIHPNAKYFIRELNNICQIYIGTGLSQTIKHKYHDHDYQNCRIVKFSETVKSESIWHEILKQSVLDIICIAAHYSSRFSSSDEFIMNHSTDQELSDSVFYLKNSRPSDLVNLFMEEYLDITISTERQVLTYSTASPLLEEHMVNRTIRQITWKNMQYLWRHFLNSKQLPALLFFGTLKSYLIEKLSNYFKEEKDSFVGICSKYLPAVQNVLEFWNETIIMDETESDFEIEELLFLYKQWCSTNGESTTNMTQKQLLDIITYFFPTIEIEQEKFISKIRCSLWDKRLDIESGKPTVSPEPPSLFSGKPTVSPDAPSLFSGNPAVSSITGFASYKVETASPSLTPDAPSLFSGRPTVSLSDPSFFLDSLSSSFDASSYFSTPLSGNHIVSLPLTNTLANTSLTNRLLIPPISINEAYLNYCKHYKSLRGSGVKKLLVSKAYFEKYYRNKVDNGKAVIAPLPPSFSS